MRLSVVLYKEQIFMYPSLGGGVNLQSYRERQYGYGINYHQVVALYNVLYHSKDVCLQPVSHIFGIATH